MLQAIVRTLGMIAGIVLVAAAHISVVTVLDRPFSWINIVFLCSMIVLYVLESNTTVWFAIAALYIIDLFSTVTPFGVTFYAGSVSILIAYWLHRRIFTNRSWYAAAALTAFIIIGYRILYFLFVLGLGVVQSGEVPVRDLFVSFFWETLLTASLVGGILLILSKLFPHLGRRTIQSSIFTISSR